MYLGLVSVQFIMRIRESATMLDGVGFPLALKKTAPRGCRGC